jgi:hypothetical protein
MTLNPEYSHATDYYAQYEFPSTQTEKAEGAAVVLDMPIPAAERMRNLAMTY